MAAAKEIDRIKARELYNTGKYSYNDLRALLGVSKSSISLWCRDLAAPRLEEESKERQKIREKAREALLAERAATKAKKLEALDEKKKANEIKRLETLKRVCSNRRSIGDEDVIFIRNDIREKGVMNLKYYAAKYNVTVSAISAIARGATRQEMNAICPPITGRMKSMVEPSKQPPRVTPDTVREGLNLRRSDPVKWTYGAIAVLWSELTGRAYQATHVSKSLRRMDPTIRDLDHIKPAPVPRNRVGEKAKSKKPSKLFERECVMCEDVFHTKYSTKETCSDTCTMALRRAQAAERAHERKMHA